MDDQLQLKQSHIEALRILQNKGGTLLVSQIPDSNETGVFGIEMYGIRTYRALEKLKLVLFTVEEPMEMEEGVYFQFTPSCDITQAGLDLLKNAN